MEATEKIISIMTRWLRCDSMWRNQTQGEEPEFHQILKPNHI